MSNPDERLKAMVANAPLCIAELSMDGRLLRLNHKGEAMLRPIIAANKLEADNLYSLLELIAPEVLEKVRAFTGQEGLILANELHSFLHVSSGSTETKYYNYSASMLAGGFLVLAIDDQTEKTLREQAIQQAVIERSVMQGKYEIAADVLHDIGNAIVGIGSYLTRIRRVLDQQANDNLKNLAGFFTTQQPALSGTLGEAKAGAIISMLTGMAEAQKNNKEDILQSVTEQTQIISHIQDILHIQRQYMSGKDTMERMSVNMRTVINDSLSMQLASMEKRNITILREISEEIPSIKGDRTRLMQVIMNILKNSIEAIDVSATEKTIHIKLSKTSETAILEVRDSGCGFDADTGRRIFGRGFTTKTSGTGLGLHSCRAIIESHGGTMEIFSEGPGKGATTTITLKL